MTDNLFTRADIKWQYEDLSVSGLKLWLAKWQERLTKNSYWNGIDCSFRIGILKELLIEKGEKV